MVSRTLLTSLVALIVCLSVTTPLIGMCITDNSSNAIPTSIKTLKRRSFPELDEHFKSSSRPLKKQQLEFGEVFLAQNYQIAKLSNENLGEAKATMSQLEITQNYVQSLGTEDLVSLPVGVKKEIGNINYVMGISKAKFNPDFTEITAFVQITLPQLDAEGNQKKLFFGANNIKLSHSGGIYGNSNLVLLGDVSMPFNGGNALLVLNGGFDMNSGNINQETYVKIDCGGFKELSLNADVVFSRSILQPVDQNYNPLVDPGAKVRGNFKSIVSDWNDIMAEVSLPPFQLTSDQGKKEGKAGLVFELNKAIFDFSDIRNHSEVKFPQDYRKYLIPGNDEAWRGVFVQSLKIVLPRQFQRKDSEERVAFQASNLLLDGMGVSGVFSAENVLPITEGKAASWQFSVDKIQAAVVTNQITAAGFAGKIVLPISKEATKSDDQKQSEKFLIYDALIDPSSDEYQLKVGLGEAVAFDMFQAKTQLSANSYIELKVQEGTFRPKAVLHGTMAIQAGNSPEKPTVDFNGITFQNLQLQTTTPYIKVDHMGYNGEVSFANFPVTISDIDLHINEYSAFLQFGVDVNMMSKGFAGHTRLKIKGKLDQSDGYHRWGYDGLDVDRINLQADLGAIKLEGFVDLKNDDPIYGDGFYGELAADFNSITVTASAWFGKKDFRYWYVDAYADLSNGPVPVTIGPALIVNGFGGGAFYRMEKIGKPMDVYSGNSADGKPQVSIPSGQSYIPDHKAGLGFRALIGFALKNEKAFNGKVGFEMAFNKTGGLNRVLFFGEGHILKAMDFKFGDKFKEKMNAMETKVAGLENNTSMDKLKESNLVDYSKSAFPQDGLTFDAGIDANFSMEMDFRNNSFHSEMEVYLNTPGNFFSGVGQRGRAGWAIFHASEENWYMHMGTPKDRVGVRVGIGSFSAKATTYLMIGDKLPGSPPPPAVVSDILGVDLGSLDYMRDLNALGEGSGFALGMDVSMNTGYMNFLIFYAQFQVGLGFDIMIKDYGEAECKGSGQIGVNGWYANGQAYAYLQGELGIRVRLLFVSKDISILKAGAAVLLQAKLPNPSWFRGYLGGYYSVLGGAIKGKFRFKIELGTECELINGSPLGGVKVIANVTPSDGSEVDVFKVPQAAFNMRVNEPFELEDDEGSRTYRILLAEATLTQDGKKVDGELEWNENSDVLNFVSDDILPPKSNLKFSVKVNFQQKENGAWKTLTQNGKVAEEVEERNFTTGEAPDYIPESNIAYCYPVKDMRYYYQGERNTGYIKLKRGQPYLFPPESSWVQETIFESDFETAKGKEVKYNKGEKIVNFKIPQLKNTTQYTFSLVSFPPKKTAQSNADNYVSQETGQAGNSVELKNKQVSEVQNNEVTTDVLIFKFSTSMFNTFADKINAKPLTKGLLEAIYSNTHALQADVQTNERFDIIELHGSTYSNLESLIRVEAILDDAYYKEKIYPLIYKDYPIKPQFTVDRNVEQLGLPPKEGVNILTWYSTYAQQQPSYYLLDKRLPFRYYLPYYFLHDFRDIQYKVVNAYLQNPQDYQAEIAKYNYIINGRFPAISKGNYKVKMKYILPGNIDGSSTNFTFYNPY